MQSNATEPELQPDSMDPRVGTGTLSDGWHFVPCPLCGNMSHRIIFETVETLFDTTAAVCLRRCDCGMLLTNPQPEGKALAAFYETASYYTHARRDSPRELLRQYWQQLQLRGWLARLRFHVEQHTGLRRFARRFAPDHFPLAVGQKLLDYGCGNGQFVVMANRIGISATGFEPDRKAAAAATASGAPVAATIEESCRLAGIGPADGFERITLRHVLEHVPNPVEALSSIAKLLSPRGLLLVTVPNAGSWQAQAFGRYWIGYDMPRHLWHFSPDTLRAAVERAGFNVVHSETVELASFAAMSANRMVSDGKPAPCRMMNVPALEAHAAGAEIVMVARRSA